MELNQLLRDKIVQNVECVFSSTAAILQITVMRVQVDRFRLLRSLDWPY